MPTTRLLPVTKDPKVWMTSPAFPELPRMSFVEARFRDSLKRVVIRSSVGRTENSSGSLINSVASMINREIVIFIISSASSIQEAMGRMMIMIIPRTRTLMATSDIFSFTAVHSPLCQRALAVL